MIRSFLVALLFSFSSLSLAADSIGVVAAISGVVTAISESDEQRTLNQGDSLYKGDELVTADGAKVQLLLNDQTSVKLGSNAALTLDDFVLNPDESGKINASVKKGLFRFVSGKISKKTPENVRVNLPNASIGVRGTEFTGEATADDSFVVLLDGGIQVSTDAGQVVIDEPDFR